MMALLSKSSRASMQLVSTVESAKEFVVLEPLREGLLLSPHPAQLKIIRVQYTSKNNFISTYFLVDWHFQSNKQLWKKCGAAWPRSVNLSLEISYLLFSKKNFVQSYIRFKNEKLDGGLEVKELLLMLAAAVAVGQLGGKVVAPSAIKFHSTLSSSIACTSLDGQKSSDGLVKILRTTDL
jgi:hypothetical protein